MSEEKITILAVDDNPDALYAVERILAHNGYAVLTAVSGEEALEKAESANPALILLDVVLPNISGFQVAEKIKSHPQLKYTPVILVSANDSLQDVIEGLQRGADDYITKPYEPEELLARLKAALRLRSIYGALQDAEESNQRLVSELNKKYNFNNIVGESSQMKGVFNMVEKVVDVDSPVLIHGPTGSGKELIARAIHYNSPRSKSPFIAKNCAALNENILESELFGHVKGAFTGALKDRKGIFETAHTGTLFLDEIGEMSPALQAKLLRVLQEGTFTPVGSSEEKRADVRIIAATHRDLSKMIDDGSFREDLYYRINVVTIDLPALSERRGDIPKLVESFIANSELAEDTKIVSDEVLDALMRYNWRGNVRELQNEVERMLIMSRGSKQISLEHISPRIINFDGVLASSSSSSMQSQTLKDAVEKAEKEVILAQLQMHGWNKSKAANSLGMSRSSLITKVKQYGFETDGEDDG